MRRPTQTVALAMTIAAVVPYVVLKLLWLGGSDIGVKDPVAMADLHSTRMVVGNNITIVLELLAIGLAVTMVAPWGRRIPAWLVFVLGAGATGLLAPILFGATFGSLLQLAAEGNVRTSGMEHLSPWVFALVYGGFGLLAVSLAVLAWHYVLDRWGDILRGTPCHPRPWALLFGAAGLVPFGAALVWWGLSGPGQSGPQAMDAVVQRTTLVATGTLALAGFVAPLLRRTAARSPGIVWLLTWAGCTTAALQAPAQVLLANGGHPTPAMLAIGILAVPGSAAYGLAVARGRGDVVSPRSNTDGRGAASRAGAGVGSQRPTT